MKSKQLIVLVLAALVLGGGGLLVMKNRRADYTQSQSTLGGSLLGEFDVNAVAGLRVTQGSNSVNVVKSGDNWVVKERGDYPANFTEVAGFVRKLSTLKVAQPVKVGASRLPMLELTADAGTRVELLGQDGKALKTLTLGKQHVSGGGDSSPFGGGGFPNGRYVQVGASTDGISVVNDSLSNAAPKPEDWIAKDFIKVEKPLSVAVTHAEATNSFHLTRDSDTADWKLADAQAGEEVDKNKLWSFNSLLSAPSFNDVVLEPDLARLGLDNPTRAVVKTAGGFTYELKLGQPDGDNYPLQVSVTAELKTAREPGAEEKPEDKERLDKEFQEALAKQREKLKAEQSFGKWTYTVSKWTVDALLKKRGELLTEKKAEAAAPAEDTPAGLPAGLQLPSLPGL